MSSHRHIAIVACVAMWLCGTSVSPLKAANMPQYQFYSTSMFSPNRQSNYTPSHINQSGSVKVQMNANRRVPLYQMGSKSGNYRVFSAEAFTKPASGNNGGFVIVGNYVAVNGGGSYQRRTNNAQGISSSGLSSLKVYSLATDSKNSLNSEMAASTQHEPSTRAAKIQRRTWMNIDEVERLEAMESFDFDSLSTLRAVTLLESMSGVQGVLADESLITADRRRAPGTPGSTGEELPIGDAILPLLLCIAAYAAIKRKKTGKQEA